MRSRLTISVVLVAAAAALMLIGCGDGGDNTAGGESAASGGEAKAAGGPPWTRSGSTDPQSKEEFVAKAEAICNSGKRQAFAEMGNYLKQRGDSGLPDAERLNEALKVVYVPMIRTQIKEIQALDPPEGEGWQVRAFLVALKEGIYSESRGSAPPQFSQAFKHSGELARALKIGACVYSGDTGL